MSFARADGKGADVGFRVGGVKAGPVQSSRDSYGGVAEGFAYCYAGRGWRLDTWSGCAIGFDDSCAVGLDG